MCFIGTMPQLVQIETRGLILGRGFVPEPSSFAVKSLGLGVRELKIQSSGFGVREQKKLYEC